jgi:hypothetical protein
VHGVTIVLSESAAELRGTISTPGDNTSLDAAGAPSNGQVTLAVSERSGSIAMPP